MSRTPKTYLTLTDLKQLFRCSRSQIWALRKDPTFPQPVRYLSRAQFDRAAVLEWKRIHDEANKRENAKRLAATAKAVAQ